MLLHQQFVNVLVLRKAAHAKRLVSSQSCKTQANFTPTMNILHYRKPHLPIWSPFDRHASFQDEMTRLFDGVFGNSLPSDAANWTPALDLYEDNNNFTVKVELPGFKKEHLRLSLHQGLLTIIGERKAEEKVEQDKVTRHERPSGGFERSVQLGSPVDPGQVNATYTDGILTVVLRKTEEAKLKQITVNVSA